MKKCKCGKDGNFCMVEDWLYGDQQPYCKKCYMILRDKRDEDNRQGDTLPKQVK
jgi:hypothetical protein